MRVEKQSTCLIVVEQIQLKTNFSQSFWSQIGRLTVQMVFLHLESVQSEKIDV